MADTGRGAETEAGPAVTLGRALAALRSAHGWTQAELAAASGVDKAQISRYERDVDHPSFRTLKALLGALHASPTDFQQVQDLLDRIVRGRAEPEPPQFSFADLSFLTGLGGGSSALGDAAPVPPDPEVDRLAREAGAMVERLVRLYFARLPRGGR